jgi:antitoxin component YwqK of YwqJK toxin-antitoxin module
MFGSIPPSTNTNILLLMNNKILFNIKVYNYYFITIMFNRKTKDGEYIEGEGIFVKRYCFINGKLNGLYDELNVYVKKDGWNFVYTIEKKSYYYINGRKCGICLEYQKECFCHTRTLKILHYISDKMEFCIESYRGKKKKEILYINGGREKYMEYYRDGNIRNLISYKNDKKDGIKMEYYKKGTLHIKCYYRNDKLNGRFIEYNNNMKLKVICHYDDDKKCEYIEYNNKGRRIIKHRLYVNDEICNYLIVERIKRGNLYIRKNKKLSKNYELEENYECLICRENNNNSVELGCGHIYCCTCLTKWIG